MSSSTVAIVGSGPAALMAADVLSSRSDAEVVILEKRKSPGRKLLIAGSSGLNISNSLPLEEFVAHYSGPRDLWREALSRFSVRDWLSFIEKDLGIGTFEGTSGRYFVENMKASKLLQAWIQRLQKRGVRFLFDAEVLDFELLENGAILLKLNGDRDQRCDAACFALGGGSYEPSETPLRWPAIFARKSVAFSEFTPSNVGYQVAWTEAFLKEAEGKPLKSINLVSGKGSRRGDAMVTRYGIEGTPVYFVGMPGTVFLDLKPDLSSEQIEARLRSVKENYSAIRRVKRQLSLCEASQALVYHFAPPETLKDLGLLSRLLKRFPIELGSPQPLSESISSAGGIRLAEMDERYMLKRFPGVFAAGEMLDWDVPTGGFLIQGCVSQGCCAALGIIDWLRESHASSR